MSAIDAQQARALALTVGCPSCGAAKLANCKQVGSSRANVQMNPHASRVQAAVRSYMTPDADGWMAMESAPKDATWFDAKDADGTTYQAHYAEDLSGSEQPAFRGFFKRAGDSFIGCQPVGWRPIPGGGDW